MSFLHTIAAFLVAILLLVSLHELGHLIAARLCGIKVLRFSVGFGKPFFTKKWRNIEWCAAPIPLGGYVKMVDTREGNVADADLPFAFDKQHPLKRIFVVAAGPLTNLILAVLLYAFSFSVGGITEILPYVGTVENGTVAARAGFQPGDHIISINDKDIQSFNDARTEMILNLESGKMAIRVQTAEGKNTIRYIDAAGTAEAEAIAKRKSDLGILPFKLANKIGRVMPNSPAEKSGLKAGDSIVSVNGQPTPQWQDWQHIIRENAGTYLTLGYIRDDKMHQTKILPNSFELPDHSQIIGQIGVGAAPDKEWQQKISHHFVPDVSTALQTGWNKTVSYSAMTFKFFGKLLIGEASLSHISGPVSIAEAAGATAKISWQAYVEFLAIVSLSLGVMNLLPVPVLDGGHLVYYTAELIRGKPLNRRVQEMGVRLGIALMLCMMMLAFFNDITRLIG